MKVLDFGIAKILQHSQFDNADLTSAGLMIGTIDYMSPEQMVGGEITGASDLYTLGIVIYEMIAGRRPFPDAPTPASVLAAMLKTPDPLGVGGDRAGGAQPHRDASALGRDAVDRYQTAGDLAVELRPPARGGRAALALASYDHDDDATQIAPRVTATLMAAAAPMPPAPGSGPPPSAGVRRRGRWPADGCLPVAPRARPPTPPAPPPMPSGPPPMPAMGPLPTPPPGAMGPPPTPPSGAPGMQRAARPARPAPVAASSASSSGLMLPLPPPPMSSPAPGMRSPTPLPPPIPLPRRDTAHAGVYDPARDAQRDAVAGRRLVWILVLVFAAVIGIIVAKRALTRATTTRGRSA